MRFKYVRYSSEHEFWENNASEDWFMRTVTYKMYVRTESELEPCNMKSAGCYIFYQCTECCVDWLWKQAQGNGKQPQKRTRNGYALGKEET